MMIRRWGGGGRAFCSGGSEKVRGNAGYAGSDGVPRLDVLPRKGLQVLKRW